jgi:hypothetical protein
MLVHGYITNETSHFISAYLDVIVIVVESLKEHVHFDRILPVAVWQISQNLWLFSSYFLCDWWIGVYCSTWFPANFQRFVKVATTACFGQVVSACCQCDQISYNPVIFSKLGRKPHLNRFKNYARWEESFLLGWEFDTGKDIRDVMKHVLGCGKEG